MERREEKKKYVGIPTQGRGASKQSTMEMLRSALLHIQTHTHQFDVEQIFKFNLFKTPSERAREREMESFRSRKADSKCELKIFK